MQHDRVVDELRDSGLSGYEAKAYAALLAAGRPLNGYEVAKASTVPRSTVYETLAKLVERGVVFEVRSGPGDQVGYLAISAESFISKLRRDYDDSIASLTRVLPAIAQAPASSLVHHLRGREAVTDRARELVQRAREDLFVSIWAEEAGHLETDLRAAVRRGVEVSIVAFGDLGFEVGHVYRHEFSSPEVVLGRVGTRLFVLADDRRSVLVGGAHGDETWAMWSDDPAVTLVAVEFVRHDIAMQVLVERLGKQTVDEFWHTDSTLERLQTGRGSPGLRR
ncbi:MAG: TrmB family transcriptional regulator [Actinobacteria bacterium]|nr:TrmB family transcriptional regulator [Actinomycetota bacterium]